MLFAIQLALFVVAEPVVTFRIDFSQRSVLLAVAIVSFCDQARVQIGYQVETMFFVFLVGLSDNERI
jgi:hypothetical protein